MKQNSLTNKFKLTIYTGMVGLWVFTTILTLTRDVDESVARYDTTVGSIRAIQVSLALPTLFIYLALSFAAVTFAIYAYRVSQSKEGEGYNYLANGLMLTIGSFALSALLNVLAFTFENTPSESVLIIARNYLSLAISFLIYWYFWRGSKILVSTLKSTKDLAQKVNIGRTAILIVSAAYTYLVFQNPYRTTSDVELIKPVFGVSDILIFTTIIIPYVITWLLAMTATINIAYYAKNVSGIIYKKLFGNLAKGFALIIGLTISLQIVGQFSEFWADSGLNSILMIIGLIFLALVAAYIQFGIAAKRLDRIETL